MSAVAWQMLPLGELADVSAGQGAPQNHDDFSDDGVPFIRAGSLDALLSGGSEDDCEHVPESTGRAYGLRLFPADTILFAKSGMSAKKGRVYKLRQPAYVTNHLAAIVPTGRSDPGYLFRWLTANPPTHLIPNESYPSIRLSDVGRVKVPTPACDFEQRRIAAILDKADAIRARRRAALADVDALARASFVYLFGDPLTNSKRLPVCTIAEYGRVVTGNTPPRANKANYSLGIEWIKSDNINTPNHFLTPAIEHLSEAGEKLSRAVPPGSILVTCIAGSPDCIGNAAIADRRVAFNQQINAIVPHIDSDTAFIYAHLFVSKKLVQLSSTNSMKGMVSKSQFEMIPFLRPSEHSRREFSKKFQKIVASHKHCTSALADADALYAALAARAFRGEL